MNTQESAIKYGVPMPETCKQLNWQRQALFAWIKKESEWILINYSDWKYFDYPTYISAPQMHEIAPLLPTTLGTQSGNRILTTKNNSLAYSFDTAPYNVDLIVGRINIINNHYAEAYAQLFLKLKKENLI